MTKPTSMTVRADDDWMAMVTPQPSSSALMGLEVRVASAFSSLPPASFSSWPDMTCMPNRKKARPPPKVSTEKISTAYPLVFAFLSLPCGRPRPFPTLFLSSAGIYISIIPEIAENSNSFLKFLRVLGGEGENYQPVARTSADTRRILDDTGRRPPCSMGRSWENKGKAAGAPGGSPAGRGGGDRR